jgi:hypothetical protein
MKFNPKEWSVLTWRLYGFFVLLIMVIYIVAVVVLRERIFKMPWIALPVAASIALFSFVWMVGAAKYGSFKKGFLLAIFFILALLAKAIIRGIAGSDVIRLSWFLWLALISLPAIAIISYLECISFGEILSRFLKG